MGKYNVRNKQDISGIATLTNNPIAVDNIRSTLKHMEQTAAQIVAVPKSALHQR